MRRNLTSHRCPNQHFSGTINSYANEPYLPEVVRRVVKKGNGEHCSLRSQTPLAPTPLNGDAVEEVSSSSDWSSTDSFLTEYSSLVFTIMIDLKRADVPEYLRESSFFLNLEEDEEFSLLSDHFKRDCSIQNADDLSHLLTTLRFWGAFNVPTELLEYTFDHPVKWLEPIIQEFWNELTFLKDIVFVMSKPIDKRMNAALEVAKSYIVDFLLTAGCSFDKASSKIAAASGDLALLIYVHKKKCRLYTNATKAAAAGGHLDCLIYLTKLYNSKLYNDDVCLAAASGGNVHCLRFLFEHVHPCWAVKLNSCKEAALNGRLECLKYAVGECGRTVTWYLDAAARSGNLECLRYVHQESGAWERNNGMSIVQSGSLECVQYAMSTGCAFAYTEMVGAARCGHLAIIQYMHELGIVWNREATANAARNGHLDCLKYMFEAGCEWGVSTCTAAAESGHMDCIIYARENGCEWDISTTIYAAKNGQIECLKYLQENGCPWDATATACAAYCNQLAALQFLHEHGCDWDVRTTDAAAQRKHKECLNYARQHGCPVSVRNSLWLGFKSLKRSRSANQYDHEIDPARTSYILCI